MSGLPYSTPIMNKQEAEKFFKRKASPDTDLSNKEFMNKKIIVPVEGTVRRFGRAVKDYGDNVVGGAKIVGSAIKSGINKVGTVIADDLFGSKENNEKQKAAGVALNEASSGKRRTTSDGSMR